MIKKITVNLFFLLFFISNLYAQVDDKRYLDSMHIAIKNTKDPYKKARKMLLLADFWSYRDTVQAFRQIKETEKIIGNNKSLKGLALIYKAGIIYDTDIPRSQKIYLEADKILQNLNDPIVLDDRAILWHNYASLEHIQGNNKNFVEIVIEKCIPLVKRSKNNSLLASYYADVGMVLTNLKEFNKSEEYFSLALEIISKNKEKLHDVEVWTLINMANMYLNAEKPEKGKEKLDQAKVLLNDIPNSQYTTLYYQFLANYYTQTNKKQQALNAINSGIAIVKQLNIPFDLQSLQFEKYKYLKNDKKYNEAAVVITEIINNNLYENENNRVNFLKEMAWVQSQIGNYKDAYKYQSEIQKITDSLDLQQNKKNILELEAKYNNEKKQNDLNQLKNKYKQQAIIFISFLVLSLGIIIFILYAQKQRKKQNAKDLLMLQKNKDLEIANALIKGSKEERNRISKDLHDGLSGRITGIKMSLENLNNPQNPVITQNILQLGYVIKEIRQTVKKLTPETLLKNGFENAVVEFCTSLQTNKTTIKTYINLTNLEKNSFNEFKQLTVYRIVQELVTNAFKHSNATEILAQITYENNLLLLTVEDNGKGFDLNTTKRNLGLNSVQERVKMLNGTISWQSKENEGTVVNFECTL